MKWSKEKVINELKNLALIIGRSPSNKDIVKKRGWDLPKACRFYFGSLNKAKLATGLPVNEQTRAYELPKKAKKLSPELGYILGVIYGDGFVDVKFKKTCLNVTDKDFADNFAVVLEKWSGKKPTARYNKKRKYYEVRLYGKRIASFLKNFDVMTISSASEEVKCSFLKGLYDSEGTVAAYNLDNPKKASRKIGFYNADEELLRLVIRILKDVGFKNIKLNSKRRSGFGSKRKQYEILLYGKKNLELFHQKIGFSIKRKLKQLEKAVKSYTKYKHTIEMYKKAIKLYKQGLGNGKISKILGISSSTVGGWIYGKSKPYGG
jgi:intein-encoded DNA endonuclease-like protein